MLKSCDAKIKVLLTGLVLLGNFICHAQTPNNARFFTVADGLSSNNINCVLEDYQGFLWAGTDYGLCRFDGNEFRVLQNVGDDSLNLIGQKIISLEETEDGRILIGTPVGISVLSANRDSLEQIRETLLSDEQRIAETTIAIKRNIIVWANRKGIFIHKNDTTISIEILSTDSTELNQIADIKLFNLNDNRFVLTAGKKYVYIVNTKGELLNNFKTKNIFDISGFNPQNGLIYTLSPLRSDTLNSIFFETYNLQGELIYEQIISSHIPEGQQKWLTLMAADSKGHYWLETNQGSHFITTQQNEPEATIDNYNLSPKGAPNLMQSDDMEYDRHHNCWIATSTGLLCIPMQKKKIHTIRPADFSANQIFSTRLIYPLNDTQLLVSSYSNFYIYNKKERKLEKTEPRNNRLINGDNFTLQSSLKLDTNHILTGSDGHGLLLLNTHTLKLTCAQNDSLVPFYVTSIEPGLNNNIWVSSYHGLFLFDLESKQPRVPPGLDSLTNQRLKKVYDLHFDKTSKTLWAACEEGLFSYSTSSHNYTFYDISIPNNPLSVNKANCIYADDETLWVGTRGDGLVRFNTQTQKIIHFSTNQGLSNNTVFSILPGPDSTVWLGTANGLSVFSRITEQFKNFYKHDGIADNEFNMLSQYIDKDGTFYMGGINGITAFHPSDVLKDQNLHTVRLSSISKHNGKLKRDEEIIFQIDQLNQIDVYPKDRYFIVNFTEDDLMEKDGPYEYQLLGLSDEWQYIGSQRAIRFTDLKPGQYTLRVKRVDQKASGQNYISLPITVHTPWYATWQAYLGYVIFLISVAVLFVRFRLRQLKIRNQLKYDRMQLEKIEELDRVKSTLFANISHELRTPLTLILGPLQAAMDGRYWKNETQIKKVLERARRNGEHLLRLIEQILDLSRLESGKVILNEQPILLEPLVKKIHSTFEPLANTKGVKWQMDYQLSSSQMLMLDEDKFEKIVYNLLSNAFKFSPPGGLVTFTIQNSGNGNIAFKITDNGKGIPTEDLPKIFDRFFQSSKMDENHTGGSGIGLAFAKELAHLLNGDLHAASEYGEGATFTLILPIREEQVETLKQVDREITFNENEPSKESEFINKASDAHVLVVEDNADMRSFLKEELSLLFKVTTAIDGQEALEIINSKEADFELILSDVMMPRMDGFTLLEKLKGNEEWQKLPVILLTAKSAVEHRIRALRIGVDDYITKPFSTTELKVRISNLVHNYRQRNTPAPQQGDKPTTSSYDLQWLEKIESICNANVGNNAFGVKDMADAMALSDRQLTRRLKELTGLTPNKYFRTIKMHRARTLFESGKYRSLSEVSFQVGFDDSQYFSKLYKSTFGKSPAELN